MIKKDKLKPTDRKNYSNFYTYVDMAKLLSEYLKINILSLKTWGISYCTQRQEAKGDDASMCAHMCACKCMVGLCLERCLETCTTLTGLSLGGGIWIQFFTFIFVFANIWFNILPQTCNIFVNGTIF